MKKSLLVASLFVAALALAVFVPAHGAHAFSTESAPVNADNSPKFADPDAQPPGFVLTPSAANSRSLEFGAPGVTAPAMGESDNGADAFEQAFTHQQQSPDR